MEIRRGRKLGDVIIFVSLLSVGLRPFILDVEGGARPVFSSREFVRLGIGIVAMSLSHSTNKKKNEFQPITAGHVILGKRKWVDSMLKWRQQLR